MICGDKYNSFSSVVLDPVFICCCYCFNSMHEYKCIVQQHEKRRNTKYQVKRMNFVAVYNKFRLKACIY